MKQAIIIKFMNRSAWLILSGISPSGDVRNFLYEDQVLSFQIKPSRGTTNYHSITSKNATCQEQMLEDILNPKPVREGDIVIIKKNNSQTQTILEAG